MGIFSDAMRKAAPTQVEGHFTGEAIEVEITGIIHRTDGAVLLDIYGEQVWVPLSQLAYADTVEGVAWVPEWIAIDKGLV